MHPLPDLAQVDALLAMGAALDGAPVFSDQPSRGPWPVYSDPVGAFFAEAGQPWWCDYDYVPRVESARLADPEAVARASLCELRSMLTCCVRSERFCDGAWGGYVQDGTIRRLLARLAELRAELGGSPG